MTRSRLAIRRRLIAFVLVLGFGFFTAESLIADACDGDSERAALSMVDGADPTSGSNAPLPAPGHTMHVCHCVHAHGGMPALMDREPSLPSAPSVVLALVESTPQGPALELQLRPPIA